MTALRITIVVLSVALLTVTSALAGPPLITDDAATVDVGKVEIELNGSSPYDKETTAGVTTKNSTADAEMKITTGLCKQLGVSLVIPYTVSARVTENDQLTNKASGFGDITVELKYIFAELAGVSVAVKPSIILPTGNYSAGLSEGRWQFGTTLIATKRYEDGKYALHANAGYEHHDYRSDEARQSNRSDIWSGSIAGEAEIVKGLFLVADFGLATNTDKASNNPPVYALTGARYEVNDLLDVNAGIKLGLTRPEDDVAFLYGLVLKF